ncbi:Abi family protein [uncultured Tateyamaria sp.]|uniref:Abi family protein n=1 Tax=uncultured Tateyamaria sp. TaxID=455651 RepID=UPI002628AFE2|nr:Abi family protein [uncultured Tateyamaria sp.]
MTFQLKTTIYSLVMGRHTAEREWKRAALPRSGPPLRHYAKPHASPTDRVQHLRSRGLIIDRPNVAARKIEAIGYERLRIYFLSRRDQPNKTFRPGTTYNHIIQLYKCDARLRALAFEAVGRFELAFRNTLSEALSSRYGSHPFYDRNAFKDAGAHNKALAQVIKTFQQSKDDRARHYKDAYDIPALPPVWTLKEFLTFGGAAHLYAALAGPVRQDIARVFGVPRLPVFDNWITCFVDLRNVCAHHDRLFNRRFQKQLQHLPREGVPAANNNTLKALLECLDHALTAAGETSATVDEAHRIMNLQIHAAVDPAEAGY